MDKRHRDLGKAIKPFGYVIDWSGNRKRKHLTIINRRTGHTLTLSASPTNVDHWIKKVLRDIERYAP